jgi:hypothetical protein
MLPVLVLFAAVSCDHEPEFLRKDERPPAPEAKPSSFDASTAGTVVGSVQWNGPNPNAPSFLFGIPGPNGNFTTTMMPNPNAPAIVGSGRIANAVVFLRGIDPSRAKPWDLPPVRVELRDRNIRVIQGEAVGRVGFVKRGDTVEMKSAEPVYHVLRARGAAAFSLTFPKPEQPLSRIFDAAGRVELTSGAGFYWANGDLFVTDHPYWTRTDATGHFEFAQVPPGSFEVVAWLPGWDVAKQERDPETGLIARQTYSAPREAVRAVKLEPKGLETASVTFQK